MNTNKMILKQKKGGAKIISVYWFVILIIIAGGIFAMVYSFYHYPYDVREIEGNLLINKIADCLSNQGQLTDELFGNSTFNESFKNNFLNNCHLNFNSEETFDNNSQYYFKITFYNLTDLINPLFIISKGDFNLLASCEIQTQKDYKREARCVENEFFSFYKGEMYLIKILTAIKKTEKNVR